jgi:hypothetical protein
MPTVPYYTKDGTRVCGSTTIGGRFKDSGALIYWAYKQGVEHEGLRRQGLPAPSRLYDTVETAASIGTTVHEMVENHIYGGNPLLVLKEAIEACEKDVVLGLKQEESIEDYRKKAMSGFEAYLAWEEQNKLEIIYQEISLVSEQYRFGGTPDAIGKLNGKWVLIDWKTSNHIYPDHLIQVASYGHLIEHGYIIRNGKPSDDKLGIKPEAFEVCRFAKEYGDFAHHHFPELDMAWEQFKLFRQAFDNDQILKKRAA